MPKGYHHLTYDQRCQIQTLKERGDSIEKIAETLKVHRSSIYREITRNSQNNKYEYKQANKKALNRRWVASSKKTKMTLNLIAIIEEKLKN